MCVFWCFYVLSAHFYVIDLYYCMLLRRNKWIITNTCRLYGNSSPQEMTKCLVCLIAVCVHVCGFQSYITLHEASSLRHRIPVHLYHIYWLLRSPQMRLATNLYRRSVNELPFNVLTYSNFLVNCLRWPINNTSLPSCDVEPATLYGVTHRTAKRWIHL